ncbi:MAG: S-layer homology domain-containing protein [Bacteroides sp.]|nr:S-layer homology domain-containing protein [Eubacterium sp.]MCM1419374.1 S-layer homology domain-containing protein [Roseburia sp.]MCM1463025.1 S-layer homology domain-containing protein [Bacteroides sp.]
MKAKTKRFASAFLALSAALSSTSVVAYAAEDEAMKQALTYVKERIEIPEEYTVFEHYSANQYGSTEYDFSWYDAERTKSISVAIRGKVITSYYSYYSGMYDSEYSFAKLTKDELAKKAEKLVKQLNPTVAANIEIVKDSLSVSVSSNRATVPLRRVKDNVPVSGQTGSISIDKNTGELLSFSLNWLPGASFADADKAISAKKAKERYLETFPISKLYTLSYNWTDESYTPHLIYKRDTVGQIDALTGKLATFEDSYDSYDGGDDDVELADEAVSVADTESGGTNTVTFTQEEQEKLELAATLLKPEDVLAEMIEAKIWSIPDAAEVSYSNTYYNERMKAYVTRASLQAYTGYVSADDGDDLPEIAEEDVMEDVAIAYGASPQSYYGSYTYNAETGEILYFYGSDSGRDARDLTEKSAKKLLNNRLAAIAGAKADEFKIDEITTAWNDTDRNGEPTEGASILRASATSPRYAYEIPCRDESVSIAIDASGRVSSYNLNYYGIEYPKPEGVIDEETAYKRYFAAVDYTLLYRLAYNYDKRRVETALVYDAGDELRIDAFTGKLTYYDGSEIPEKTVSGYTDLDRSGYREIAEKLAVYGITLMDDKGRLNADMTITRGEFADFVRYIGHYGSPSNPEKALTRKYAARILTTDYIGLAELPGLFKSPFSDVKEDDPYVGYIAIANALGLMTGEDGKFRPSAKMTRGDALQLVYDYLSR